VQVQGVICGVLIGELAKGKPLAKILRAPA
jgi:hypothetical protein